MPYLQLDLSSKHSVETKRQLARHFGAVYARVMHADVKRVSVAIRELGPGGLWRCTEGEPYEAALLMCDIRRGRPVEVRETLAKELIAVCMAVLQLEMHEINLEFTQHAGDEMYHPMLGGLSQDWQPEEA